MFVFEKLAWDTNFFKRKIGKITLEESYLNTDLKPEIIRLKELGFELIYIFVENAQKLSEQLVSEFKIKLVDTKLTYSAIVNCKSEVNQLSTYKGSSKLLYSLVIQSGEYSRYKIDKNFKNAEFEKLYYEWINKSLNSDYADYVPAFYVEDKIAGFATVKVINDVGIIGLIAVDNLFRSKGIGKILINSINNYLINSGVYKVEVATQLENSSACFFYEKMGFQIKSKTNIYHLWL